VFEPLPVPDWSAAARRELNPRNVPPSGLRSASVHAKRRQQLSEHVEVPISSPHGEIVGDRGRSDDRVHRPRTPPSGPRPREQLAKPLRYVLVIGQRYKGARTGKRGFA
jgi:hypothetical protein